MVKTIDTSDEMILARRGDGIQLVKPDRSMEAYPHLNVAALLQWRSTNIYFLNPESNIIRVNDNVIETLQFLTHARARGCSVRLVAKRETADYCIRKDYEAIQSNRLNISEVNFQRYDDIYMQGISFKYPWHDADNKIIGLISICLKTEDSQPGQIVNFLNDLSTASLLSTPRAIDSVLPGRHLMGIYLSAREFQCLKLLILGKTAKATAQVLGLSYRTVESYLQSVKLKFKVTTKSDLIEKVIGQFLS